MFKTAIILAGGKSSRMGEDKALMRFGDRPLLHRVVDELRPHFEDLVLVTNQVERHMDLPDIRIVTDVHPGEGPLGGIFAGLLASRGRHNLVVGCDMPFLNHLLLDYLWSLRTWGDVVVPITHEALAPICAVYDRQVLPTINEALEAGERRVMGLYPRLKVHYVREDELLPYDPELRSLENLNTPEDYRRALSTLAADR
jgi:molybdopterin-guanine dinucleotide biosynthesis protein A